MRACVRVYLSVRVCAWELTNVCVFVRGYVHDCVRSWEGAFVIVCMRACVYGSYVRAYVRVCVCALEIMIKNFHNFYLIYFVKHF